MTDSQKIAQIRAALAASGTTPLERKQLRERLNALLTTQALTHAAEHPVTDAEREHLRKIGPTF